MPADKDARARARARLVQALWRIYNRSSRPQPWAFGGNLPWDDPGFSARMLREHLDETHSAASRTSSERKQQLEWLWSKLSLEPGDHLLDVTCGPGLYAVPLAKRGCRVVGVDFGPAALAHARRLADEAGVAGRCRFVNQDVRQLTADAETYDAAILLYGQLAVMTRAEAQTLLGVIARSLKPGGRLCLELLDQERVDKQDSTWWYTDNSGLWGNAPYLHLGERFWHADEAISVERFQILHLDTGVLDEILLCDQTYAAAEMVVMLEVAGFTAVSVYPHWDDLALHDADEWMVCLAER